MSSQWRPSAKLDVLSARARLLARIRDFMQARGVLEVTTPVLGQRTVTDPNIHSFEVRRSGDVAASPLYLRSSPEFAMKRLLAAGSGAVYEIGPAFRDDERGALHNPEFTLLEWYRPGFDLSALIDEVDALLAALLGCSAGRRTAYRALFMDRLGLDPFQAEQAALAAPAAAAGLANAHGLDRTGLLEFLFSRCLQPALETGVVHVHDFPPEQAALARIVPGPPAVARRVEVFVDRVELANGYEELTDPNEQRARMQADLGVRHARGAPEPSPDERLEAALVHGLPSSAGIALGFDRLVMLALGASSIDQVLSFPIERA